eukprot:5742560-Prymnesium_polylepis.1
MGSTCVDYHISLYARNKCVLSSRCSCVYGGDAATPVIAMARLKTGRQPPVAVRPLHVKMSSAVHRGVGALSVCRTDIRSCRAACYRTVGRRVLLG